MNPIRVQIIESHTQVRHALAGRLRAAPQVKVIATTAGIDEGLEQATTLRPDVLLLDAKAAKCWSNGLSELLSQFDQLGSGVIVLATYSDESDRAQVLRAGARRYLLKDVESNALIDAIVECAAGGSTTKPDSS